MEELHRTRYEKGAQSTHDLSRSIFLLGPLHVHQYGSPRTHPSGILWKLYDVCGILNIQFHNLQKFLSSMAVEGGE